MFCSKCGKQNNQESKFCNSCGSKIDNNVIDSINVSNENKKNNTKTILITVGIVILVLLLVGIISAVLFIRALGKGIDEGIENIKDTIDSYEEKEEYEEDLYDSIPKELINRNLISDNLKYVASSYEWGMESVDKTDKYYFYITSEQYDNYKSYWLEDVNKSQYREGYNRNLWETGDYVFYAINVSDLKYSSDIQYGNINLKANKQYYLVQIYDEAIYFKYIWNYKEDGSYLVDSNFKYKDDSLSKEYIFSQDGNKWLIEELIR